MTPGMPILPEQAIRARLKEGQPVDEEGARLVYLLQLHACTFRRALRQAVKRVVADLRQRTGVDEARTGGDGARALSAAEECQAASDTADLLAASTAAVTSLEQVCACGMLGCSWRRPPGRPSTPVVCCVMATASTIVSTAEIRMASQKSVHLVASPSVLLHMRERHGQSLCAPAQACADCEDDERVPGWLREEWRLVDEQILVEGRVSLLKLAARVGELCPASGGPGPAGHAHPPESTQVMTD